jgi:hypothetical protein
MNCTSMELHKQSFEDDAARLCSNGLTGSVLSGSLLLVDRTALRVGTPIRRSRHGSTASRGRAQRPNTKTFVNAKMNEQIVLE